MVDIAVFILQLLFEHSFSKNHSYKLIYYSTYIQAIKFLIFKQAVAMYILYFTSHLLN